MKESGIRDPTTYTRQKCIRSSPYRQLLISRGFVPPCMSMFPQQIYAPGTGMVHLQCQLGWIWRHLGDTPLAAARRVFPSSFHEKRKTRAECGQHYPRGCSPRLKKRETKEANWALNASPLLRKYLCDVSSFQYQAFPHLRESSRSLVSGSQVSSRREPPSPFLTEVALLCALSQQWGKQQAWCMSRPRRCSPLPPFLLGEPQASLLNGW